MIHTVKGFSVVNEAEVDIFLKFSGFSVIEQMLAVWSLVSLPFLNPAVLDLENLEILDSRTSKA